MSRLSAVRTASRTAVGTHWWHLSFSTGGFDDVDGIIEALITPLVAHAKSLGAKRWYFTRYEVPATGGTSGVRLSVHAHPRVLGRLQALERARRTGCTASFPRLTAHQQFTPAAENTYYSGGAEMADPQLESNLVKYGGVEGLLLAEEVFELSSELAVWSGLRFPRMQNRSALAALILFDAAQAMMLGPRSAGWQDRRQQSWEHYWDSHLRTCTVDAGSRGPGLREAMTARVASKSRDFHALMAATASEQPVQNWRRRWFRAVDTYLYRAEGVRVSRSAQHLTVYQAHMALNRLGFGVYEEAVLGLHASSWQPQTDLMHATPRIRTSHRAASIEQEASS